MQKTAKNQELNLTFDVTGIGNACLDIVDRIDQNFIETFSLRKSHCIYIAREVLEAIKIALPNHALISGGSVANTIHCLKALGLHVSFQGIIADDNEGKIFKTDLERNDISAFLAVTHEKGLGTTQVCCLITEDGDRSFASYDGAARTLSQEHLNFNVIENSSITYFDGYTMYSPTAFEAFEKAIATAGAAKKLTAFNPADLSIIQSFPHQTKKLADCADILLCNLVEANALYGFKTLEECAENLPQLKFAGAVTDGGRGAIVFKNNQIFKLSPTAEQQTPIDTNGAGDHFAAGILYGIIKDLELSQMANLAHLAALDCISHKGARPLGSLAHLVEHILKKAA